MNNQLKILIVDDHPAMRNGLIFMLNNQTKFNPIMDEAIDGEQAIEKLNKNNFDVVILDINLPKRDGISVAKYIKTNKINVKILAFSIYKEDYVIRRMVDAGSLGFILKYEGLEVLTDAVLAVSKNNRYYSNEVSLALLDYNSSLSVQRKKISTPAYFKDNLTEREKQILALIAQELTNNQIAQKLNVTKKTVDYHRENINKKLNTKNTAGIVRYAVLNGLLA